MVLGHWLLLPSPPLPGSPLTRGLRGINNIYVPNGPAAWSPPSRGWGQGGGGGRDCRDVRAKKKLGWLGGLIWKSNTKQNMKQIQYWNYSNYRCFHAVHSHSANSGASWLQVLDEIASLPGASVRTGRPMFQRRKSSAPVRL